MVEAEMEWYVRYTLHRNTRATEWADAALSPGHRSYALRQADMWRRVGTYAKELFGKTPGVKIDVDIPFPHPDVKVEPPA